jgi:hypothetical protein
LVGGIDQARAVVHPRALLKPAMSATLDRSVRPELDRCWAMSVDPRGWGQGVYFVGEW